MSGAEAVLHIAGDYRVGIKESEHETMFRTNVDGAVTVLDAAVSASVGRIVYVSTVTVFGNTRGKVVDETYERPDRDFLSYYDATKYMGHRVAVARAAAGAPLVIVQPGAVYGPGDGSELGAQIERAARGKHRLRAFPELGLTMSYVDDVADGMVLALTKGRPGESYILGGEVTRLGDVVDRVADLTGNKRARLKVPSPAFRRRGAVRIPRRPVDRRRPEPARGRARQQGRHVLGDERQGRARARVRPAQPRRRGFATFSPRAESARAGPAARPARPHAYLVKYSTSACCSSVVTVAPSLDHVVDQRLGLGGARQRGSRAPGPRMTAAAAGRDDRRRVRRRTRG